MIVSVVQILPAKVAEGNRKGRKELPAGFSAKHYGQKIPSSLLTQSLPPLITFVTFFSGSSV
jgi:hypothetical protein